MTDFRAGSLSGRRSPLPPLAGQINDPTAPDEIVQSGYLNRKCVHEAGSKKSKDRSWATLWCTIKGTVMEFFKADVREGKSPRPSGGPPPKDMFPPPNLKERHHGSLDLENCLVDIDYTSQINKDIDKRRSFLFQLVLIDNTEYIFQAPSEKNRTAWVMAMKQASRRVPSDEIEGGGVHSLAHSIKSSRDSIKHKSRQNVHSIKKHHTSVPMHVHGTMGSIDESELMEVPVAQSLVGGDPQLREIKKRLIAKKEILKQIKTMYTSFMGGTGALYADALIHHEGPEHTSHDKEEGVVHRRMSLPESKGQNEGEDKRSSTGEYCVPITTPLYPGVQSVGGVTETELLLDYYLVPGAQWSLLRKGETVRVLGQASNGWYQCMALRTTSINMDVEVAAGYSVYSSISSGTSELSSSLEESDFNQSSLGSEVNLDSLRSQVNQDSLGSQVSRTSNGSEVNRRSSASSVHESESVPPAHKTSISLSDLSYSQPDGEDTVLSKINRTRSYKQATTNAATPVTSVTKTNVGRTESYMQATDGGEDHFEDVLIRKSNQKATPGKRKAITIGRSTSAVTPATHSNICYRRTVNADKRRSESASLYLNRPASAQTFRLMAVLQKERKTGTYSAPLIGCIAPSALKCCSGQAEGAAQQINGDLSLSNHQDNEDADLRSQSTLSDELEERPASNEIPELQNLIPTLSVYESDRPQSADLILESNSTVHQSIPESLRPKSAEPDTDLEKIGLEFPSQTELNKDEPTFVAKEPDDDQSESLGTRSEKGDRSKDEFVLVEYQEEPSVVAISPTAMDRSGRAKSLPPPTIDHTPLFPVANGGAGPDWEQARNEKERQPPHSVVNTKSLKRGSHDSTVSIDQGTKPPSFFKKLFAKKKGRSASSPVQIPSPPTSTSHTASPRKRPHTISRKFKPEPLQNVADDVFFDNSEGRLRVASMSGRPVRCEGVGLVIGDDSSSESEDENEDEETVSVQGDSVTSDQSPGTALELEEKLPLSRQVSDIVTSSSTSYTGGRMKRSASDHDTLALSLQREVIEEEPPPKSSLSLKKNLKYSFRKTRVTSEESSSPLRKSKKQRKKSLTGPEAYKLSEAITPSTPEINTKWDVIFRAPPRGEKRYVYLDPEGAGGKYGFRLQSYGRVREQGKVLQTFVQSVVPGSVSFLAGLYPGDTIIEVNGVDVKYAPVEEVVKGIHEGAETGARIALKVEFVDGVTRLDRMKASDDVKAIIKDKQLQLSRLIEQSKDSTIRKSLHSPPVLTPVTSLTPWSETTPTNKPKPSPFGYDRQLNSIVSLHTDSVTGLLCDVLVMPLSSCHQPNSGTDNVLLHLLRTGGDGLLNELSLAKQCRLGENIITGGHDLHAQSIYHCAFGNLEESLQRCCVQALSDASSRGHRNIVFWLDGFVSIAVSPQIVIESVRQWLGGNNSVLFDRVVFSAKANVNIIENFLGDAFPLENFAPRDSIISEQSSTVDLESGMDLSDIQNQNGTDLESKSEESIKDKLNESDSAPETESEKPLLFQNTEEITNDNVEDVVGDLPAIIDTKNTKRLDKTSVSDVGIQLGMNLDNGNDEDGVEDLPVIAINTKKPLLQQASVSDIGIQLQMSLDEDNDENVVPVLKFSDSDSDRLDSDNSAPSLLSMLTGNSDPKQSSSLAVGSSTPPSQTSSLAFATPLSKTTPTRGLVVVLDSRTPSPSSSPRFSSKNSPQLVLNPDRLESEV